MHAVPNQDLPGSLAACILGAPSCLPHHSPVQLKICTLSMLWGFMIHKAEAKQIHWLHKDGTSTTEINASGSWQQETNDLLKHPWCSRRRAESIYGHRRRGQEDKFSRKNFLFLLVLESTEGGCRQWTLGDHFYVLIMFLSCFSKTYKTELKEARVSIYCMVQPTGITADCCKRDLVVTRSHLLPPRRSRWFMGVSVCSRCSDRVHLSCSAMPTHLHFLPDGQAIDCLST